MRLRYTLVRCKTFSILLSYTDLFRFSHYSYPATLGNGRVVVLFPSFFCVWFFHLICFGEFARIWYTKLARERALYSCLQLNTSNKQKQRCVLLISIFMFASAFFYTLSHSIAVGFYFRWEKGQKKTNRENVPRARVLKMLLASAHMLLCFFGRTLKWNMKKLASFPFLRRYFLLILSLLHTIRSHYFIIHHHHYKLSSDKYSVWERFAWDHSLSWLSVSGCIVY